MNKATLLLAMVLCCFFADAQNPPQVNRTTNTTIPVDFNIFTKNRFKIPVVSDTSVAAITPDSLGLLIYAKAPVSGFYFRDTVNTGGHKWSNISSGGSVYWGDVLGSIYNQTDLINYIDSVFNSGGGGSIEYIIGGTGVKVDSAGRVYTVSADTSFLVTHYHLDSTLLAIASDSDHLVGVWPIILNRSNDTIYFSLDPDFLAVTLTDGIKSGGYVSWSGTGLIYDNTAVTYVKNGVLYSLPAGQRTLTPADPTFSRYDVPAVDDVPGYDVVEGEAIADPAIPPVDYATQLPLTSIFVSAGDTIPVMARYKLYDINVGSPTEADWTTGAGLTASYSNLINPFSLTHSIDVNSWLNTGTRTLTGTYATPFNRVDLTLYKMRVDLKSDLPATSNIQVRFYNNTTAVTAAITITAAYGFSKTDVGYQNITLPLSAISFLSNTFNRVVISVTGAGPGMWLDLIELQGNINPGGPPTDGRGVAFYGKNSTGDSTFLLLNDGTRYAAKDSVGSGGGSGSVEYVVAGVGIKVDSAARVYTVNADTASLVSSKEWFYDRVDSLVLALSGQYVPLIRILTINGVAQDLSANRTWTIPNNGTVVLYQDSCFIINWPGGLSDTACISGSGGTTLTGAQGDIIYFSATDVVANLAKDVNATRYLSNQGTSNNPSWNQVNLTNGVTGVLPVPNGGTNNTSFTAYSPIYAGTTSTGAFQSSSLGASGTVLTSTGTGSIPTWQTSSGGAPIDSVYLRWNSTSSSVFSNNGGKGGTAAALNNTGIGFRTLMNCSTCENNIAIGNGAMDSLTVTGGRNIAIGNNALKKLKSINAIAGNIAIGMNALANDSLATRQIAIGDGAFGAISSPTATAATSTNSVAVGVNAFASITGTSGQPSGVAIGYIAASAVTTGYQNIAIGQGTSLLTTTTAATVIGHTANITGGNYGVAIGNGTKAGGENTVSIGSYAVATNSSSARSIFIGGGASLFGGISTANNVDGNEQVIIGVNAANAGTAVTGARNTVVGYSAVTGITGAAADNIAFGANVALLSNTGTSQFVLGSGSSNNRWLISDVSGSARRWTFNGTTTDISATTTGAALEVRSTLGAFMPPVMTGVQATALVTAGFPVGGIVYVTSTDGSFTSVGFWGNIAGTVTALHL